MVISAIDARYLRDALERADRQVARIHRNRHETRLGRVTVLRVRALRTHEKPAVGLQGGHDFACGHATKGIVFHSLRHTTATLLARAKVHPSVAQKILQHMARTPRTIELSNISVRVPLEIRTWLDQRMKETGRQSLNEVVNDLIEDARSWYRLPAPMIDALDRDRKSRKAKDSREYVVNLLLDRYVSIQK